MIEEVKLHSQMVFEYPQGEKQIKWLKTWEKKIGKFYDI